MTNPYADTSIEELRCEAITKNGQRCRRKAEWRRVEPPNAGAIFCHTHRHGDSEVVEDE